MKLLFTQAKLTNMDSVLDFVNKHIEGCGEKIRNQIEVAVDEIFSNIASHVYHPAIGDVMVRIAVEDDITIEFTDSGVAYDPLTRRDTDSTALAEEREAGGPELFMVKKIMDSVEYRREGRKNILTIKKGLM